eukprot:10536564-Alexandrium_andersonii.AAC.1
MDNTRDTRNMCWGDVHDESTSAKTDGDSCFFTLQGAQNAIRNTPNARQCSNPPQSAIRQA